MNALNALCVRDRYSVKSEGLSYIMVSVEASYKHGLLFHGVIKGEIKRYKARCETELRHQLLLLLTRSCRLHNHAQLRTHFTEARRLKGLVCSLIAEEFLFA